MLTKIHLDGVMGKRFGKEWTLDVDSPAEALNMINANRPGLFAWIKSNLHIYSTYRVICTSENGNVEELVTDEYLMQRKLKEIRFVPIVEGASGALKVVIGVILIVASPFMGPLGAMAAKVGWSLVVSGVIQMLTPMPKKPDSSTRDDGTSYFFNGPVNTTSQGVPVPLIYGRCLVGSHAISARVTVDQI